MSRGQGRVYWRDRGGVQRAYGDFRVYGGKREPLVARGEELATADPIIAQALFADRLKQLDAATRDRVLHGITRRVTLEVYAGEHLQAKIASGKVTAAWVAANEHFLERAVAHFGAERQLTEITTADVRQWMDALRTQANGRGETLSGGTILHHLNALANLYRRAIGEGVVPTGYNPVAAVMDKPDADAEDPLWLEVSEAALFLEAARTCPAPPAATGQLPVPFGYELIATYLLTGGRQDEVLGLEVADVDFDRKTVTFRPNAWRRLKTEKSHRTVPLWPQLDTLLRDYLRRTHRISGLVFPSDRTGEERMLVDVRKLLDRVTAHAGTVYVMDGGRRRKAEPGEIRTKAFRHTYCTTRLQTLDHGQPVAVWTVAKELGHESTDMIERVYGHLGTVRHRAKAVEYRVRQHRRALKGRLQLVA